MHQTVAGLVLPPLDIKGYCCNLTVLFGKCTCGIVASGGEHVDVIIGAAVADGKVTPKVQSLIKILMKYQHTEDFRAIVFVERVVAALVLPKVRYPIILVFIALMHDSFM